ncbi:MAG: SulP family inorganic anion transporter [Gemmatimonadota bacterium]|nr:SulP family inorganic anion transporter [Gemmatimonadota bacterium]
MGFGVASSLENGAVAGLYGAIAIGIVASIFGGTPAQISGPTGPMTVVVAGFAAAHTGDPSWVFVTVALAGLFQVIIGVLKLGKYINYIPYPVISGFMSGIGIIIILLQVSQLIGQPALKSPIEAISVLPEQLVTMNVIALLLGLGTMAIVYLAPLVIRAVPGTLVGLIFITTLSVVFSFDVPRIGHIPSGVPSLLIPQFDWAMFQIIVVPALALAVDGKMMEQWFDQFCCRNINEISVLVGWPISTSCR